jgi:hypothetical protein
LRLSQVYEGTCFGHIMVKVANMLEMMKKWLQVWSMFVWRLSKTIYKWHWHGQKN